MKRVFIRTFGCQMNEYDSERMYALIKDEYTLCQEPKEADLILVNTCSVRKKAEEKVYGLVGRLKHLKKQRPDLIIGVCGCVAQQEGEKILKRLPHVDMVLGPQAVYRLPEALEKVKKGQGPVIDTEFKPDFHQPLIFPHLNGTRPVKAFVTIMQGCDNFCAYCVVPYTRGREISRPPEEILAEIECLVKQGVREVMLLGQNVNSYGRKEKGFPSFAKLLREVAQIKGLWRIRFTTSHPKDLDHELMEAIADIPQVCEHLHLPVQAGSNRVLKRMNRKYTREEYLAKVEQLRKLCLEICLTTDIIVGFPGESPEDFEETLSLLKEVRYAEIFSFKYSDRPLARATQFEDKVPEEEKARRLAKVHKLQEKITREINESFIGREVEVLVEGKSHSNETLWTGRTRSNHVVNFEGEGDLKGKLVHVLIESCGQHSLRGQLVNILRGE
ncbi:RNA modification enzyme, MiaB family [Thermodesulfatator indicus DSM 15286]|uniref:tRNA-2-methylthio-N(6)-dimethylallyladenosine synthase n=1 Tax=Thermodesulfatator indicus (strain DSM 15286 / JCM 11887 / CIR29812) TaxID=667014 RepID=F8AD77_THEID|nr:tRNA (N6-isopentenyl adenosine(37)-C2)-methylthiotransferase MiaB [Thermodesulfatator indicus]AEH44809.1 RNA modification enzyme, MiaB family [Thermodesulfatator indicus DSM 15286]